MATVEGMFTGADLVARQIAAVLPSRAGYRLTQWWTPRVGGEPRRWTGQVVRDRVRELLSDDALAEEAGRRFLPELACDDLDAFTAVTWSESRRLASTTVVGAEYLPKKGPVVVTSFHLSGGFRVFDVLRAHHHEPLFLHAPPAGPLAPYAAAVQGRRENHLRRTLRPPFLEPGPGTRDQLDRHLSEGGAVVALLDVTPTMLDLRDRVPTSLFGRTLDLPVGLLRLATKHRAPVVPYDGRLERDARVLEFHSPSRAEAPEALLVETVATFERIIRERPWVWQAWPALETFFGDEAGSRPVAREPQQ